MIYVALVIPETAPLRRKKTALGPDPGPDDVAEKGLDGKGGRSSNVAAYLSARGDDAMTSSSEIIAGATSAAEDGEKPAGGEGAPGLLLDEREPLIQMEPEQLDPKQEIPTCASSFPSPPYPPPAASTSTAATEAKRRPAILSLSGMSRGWSVLLASSWYIRLSLIWALVCAMTNGSQVRRTKRDIMRSLSIVCFQCNAYLHCPSSSVLPQLFICPGGFNPVPSAPARVHHPRPSQRLCHRLYLQPHCQGKHGRSTITSDRQQLIAKCLHSFKTVPNFSFIPRPRPFNLSPSPYPDHTSCASYTSSWGSMGAGGRIVGYCHGGIIMGVL